LTYYTNQEFDLLWCVFDESTQKRISGYYLSHYQAELACLKLRVYSSGSSAVVREFRLYLDQSAIVPIRNKTRDSRVAKRLTEF